MFLLYNDCEMLQLGLKKNLSPQGVHVLSQVFIWF